MTLLFLDANVPMYAAGADHPLREACRRIMRHLARQSESFVTDAEVLQEALHRYLALGRAEQGRSMVLDLATVLAGRIEAIFEHDVRGAALLSSRHPALSARDLLHLAVIRRLSVEYIVSTDSGFDGIPGLRRLSPADLNAWGPEFGLTS
jgi:predicted nucleic acid-binding protein